MDSKQKTLVAASVVCALCAAACVTARLQTSNTPLYTYRMEQVSSKMHFLPTERTTFTYTAETGLTVPYAVSGYYGGTPLNSQWNTCAPTCLTVCPETCDTCDTCVTFQGIVTCASCKPTCASTCDTCPWTCEETCDIC